MDGSKTTDYGKDLAYDLRQQYAKIVGEHLEDVAEARKADNFYVWFKNLEDLHTIVKHKFKKPTEDEKEYQDAVKKAREIANKHAQVWVGVAKEPQAMANIEQALREIEMLLYEKMNDAHLFGMSGRIAGL